MNRLLPAAVSLYGRHFPFHSPPAPKGSTETRCPLLWHHVGRNAIRILVTLLVFWISLVRLSGVDVSLLIAEKGVSYWQSGPDAPVPDEKPYYFLAMVETEDPVNVLSASIQSPSGHEELLSWEGSEEDYSLEIEFDSLPALNAAAPDHPTIPYTFTVSTLHDGIRKVGVLLQGPAYPNAPRLLNYTAAQAIATDASFRLEWTPFAGGTEDDLILVSIATETVGEIRFESGLPGEPNALDGSATGVELPVGILQPDQAYQLEISFIKLSDSNSDAYPGASAYAIYTASTQTRLRTTGAPVGPELAELTILVGQNQGFLDPAPAGSLVAVYLPSPYQYFVMNLRVQDSEFPESVTFHSPPGSGLNALPSHGHFDWDPGERVYVTERLNAPPYPPGGLYHVDYGTTSLPFPLDDPQEASRRVLAVPTMEIDPEGNLHQIDWIFQTPEALDLPAAPEYLEYLDIRVDTESGPNLYYGDNLPPEPASHELETSVSWSEVGWITFTLVDDHGNQFESTFQKTLDPIILTRTLPDFPRLQPIYFEMEGFGGSPPYQWSFIGWYPEFLDLSPGGVLTAAQPTGVTGGIRLKITDNAGRSSEKDFKLRVYDPNFRNIQYYALIKRAMFRQDSPIRVEFPAVPEQAEFEGVIRLNQPNAASNAVMRAVGSDSLSLIPSPSGDRLQYISTYDSLETLRLEFPPDTVWSFSVDTMTDGFHTFALTQAQDAFPTAPFISNLEAAQFIDSTQGFALEWEPWVEGTDRDFVVVQITDAVSGEVVAEFPEIFNTAARTGTFRSSMQLNAGWLRPGRRYHGWVAFVKMTQRVDGIENPAYHGAAAGVAFASVTQFTLGAAMTYSDWAAQVFSLEDLQNPAVSGMLEDPDFDHRPNLLEFGFDLNPLQGDFTRPWTYALEKDALVIEFRSPAGIRDDAFIVEASHDLSHWLPLNVAFPGETIAIERQFETSTPTIRRRIHLPHHTGTWFFRLGVGES